MTKQTKKHTTRKQTTSKKSTTAAPAVPDNAQPIQLPSSPRTLLIVQLEGTSMLVTHRFPEKAKHEIRAKQQNLAKPPKAARDPEKEFQESVYVDEDGIYGFPTGALAESIVCASVDVKPKSKSMLRRNIFVEDGGYDHRDGRGLILVDSEPELREDVVRLAGVSRSADLRYRGAFAPGWTATARIWFDERMVSREQVLQFCQIAGESIGLCEGRPEKTLAMGWGKFKITSVYVVEPKKVAG